MNDFIQTDDGSNTLFSKKYNQYFHDIKTGAIKESLNKHVIPAISFHKDKQTLNILDICFGLGYNTLSTIYYIKKNNLNIQINIFSPELDKELVNSLKNFTYPKEFNELEKIIKDISNQRYYKDKNLKVEVFVGNAREYIKNLSNIDIVYQDAFSSDVNKELWSVEYFKDIFNICNNDCILTTYSIATPVRLSLFEAGFEIYQIKPEGEKKQTIAIKTKKNIDAKYIDMHLKKIRNKEAKPLYD